MEEVWSVFRGLGKFLKVLPTEAADDLYWSLGNRRTKSFSVREIFSVHFCTKRSSSLSRSDTASESDSTLASFLPGFSAKYCHEVGHLTWPESGSCGLFWLQKLRFLDCLWTDLANNLGDLRSSWKCTKFLLIWSTESWETKLLKGKKCQPQLHFRTLDMTILFQNSPNHAWHGDDCDLRPIKAESANRGQETRKIKQISW